MGQRSISQRRVAKRVVISWGVTCALGMGLGAGLTAALADKTPEVLPETQVTVNVAPAETAAFVPYDVPLSEDLQAYIYTLAQSYNLDYSFVIALIEVESAFNPTAISNTDDWGLMQINAVNHPYLTETLGITDYLNPYENVRGGLYLLRELFGKYEAPEKALIAYQMGETGAAALWKQGIVYTDYAERVFAVQARLNEER